VIELWKRLIPRCGILGVVCAAALMTLPMLASAQSKGAAVAMVAAPVPLEIATAKKAFIANSPGFNAPASLGGPSRAYNEFYAAMKSWGHYELVSSPADADLIFEISYSSNSLGLGTRGCSSSSQANLCLTILDAKIPVALWWLTEPVTPKASFGHHPETWDSAFARSIGALLDGVKNLAGVPAPVADNVKK
jgi:hypothetical protein